MVDRYAKRRVPVGRAGSCGFDGRKAARRAPQFSRRWFIWNIEQQPRNFHGFGTVPFGAPGMGKGFLESP